MHHDDLLAQARHLAATPNATQADLRRAVSSAYYAVFHFFVHETVEHLLGGRPATPETRQAFARSFSHGSMREACNCFTVKGTKKTGGAPAPAEAPTTKAASPGASAPPARTAELPRVGPVTIPGALQVIAASFITLIEARHIADYDLSTPTAKSEADALILVAEQIMQSWAPFRGTPDGYLFAPALQRAEVRAVTM